MPLVAHSDLPSFEQLRLRGEAVLTLDRALKQDIRELHVGLLNMMPDAALAITEQQYLRLVGSCNQIAQFYVHPFTVPGLPRGAKARAHIAAHYSTFEELRTAGLDALIVSGANVTHPSLAMEPFWEPLQEVIAWASENVTSILCSCLATHALVQDLHSVERRPLPAKQWGVYSHRVCDRSHPLLRDINTRFDVPHSRWNEVTREDLEGAGLEILVESAEAGVQMAASADGIRIVYLQGHPEYFHNSLLKEYKREALRFLNGEIERTPPYPENYFTPECEALLTVFLEAALEAKARGLSLPELPEAEIDPYLDNTWVDTGKSVFNNWLGLVYQLTSLERRAPFSEGVDPADPLGRLRSRCAA